MEPKNLTTMELEKSDCSSWIKRFFLATTNVRPQAAQNRKDTADALNKMLKRFRFCR